MNKIEQQYRSANTALIHVVKHFTFRNVLAKDLGIIHSLFTRSVGIQMSSHVLYLQLKIHLRAILCTLRAQWKKKKKKKTYSLRNLPCHKGSHDCTKYNYLFILGLVRLSRFLLKQEVPRNIYLEVWCLNDLNDDYDDEAGSFFQW